MFEKEAEEWVISNTEIYDDKFGIECEKEPQAKEAYLAGAEFGYNKAKEEIKLLKETHRQSLDILVAQIEELHKANEWHYVKDGDLPKENEYIMIYSKLADNIAVGKRRCAGKVRKRCVYEWYFATYEGTYCLRDKDIIAWKEIELPKEIGEK